MMGRRCLAGLLCRTLPSGMQLSGVLRTASRHRPVRAQESIGMTGSLLAAQVAQLRGELGRRPLGGDQ